MNDDKLTMLLFLPTESDSRGDKTSKKLKWQTYVAIQTPTA